MRVYKVSYWSEGPGMSHMEETLVLAKNKKAAIKLANKKCCVYKADRDMTSAKRHPIGEGLILGEGTH